MGQQHDHLRGGNESRITDCISHGSLNPRMAGGFLLFHRDTTGETRGSLFVAGDDDIQIDLNLVPCTFGGGYSVLIARGQDRLGDSGQV